MKQLLLFIFISSFLLPQGVFSHPGRTDSRGGHTCRTNCGKWGLSTGQYHSHGSSSVSPAIKKKTSESSSLSSESLALSKKYNRKDWPHWIDENGDCQNTRAEILIRDNVGEIKFKRNKPCNVSWGKWICPYTGKVFEKASDIDIDHIVPLKHAHKTGGANWSREKKRQFANDPENLLAVEDNINQGKGYKGPVKWKPPRKGYWKVYAQKWLHIKKKYGLYISTLEMSQLNKMLKQ